MFLNTSYVISQMFSIAMFLCLAFSYFTKNREKILLLNIFAQIFQNISTVLLNGASGAIMSLVLLISNTILYVDYKTNKKKSKKRSIIILVLLLLMVLISAIFTYNGIRSLYSVAATIIILISVWQENTKNYKILGVTGSTLWLLYFNHLKSIFGVILELVLIVVTIISYIKKEKMVKN